MKTVMEHSDTEENRLGGVLTLLRDTRRLFVLASGRRKRQLGALLVLQVCGALSEIVSLGALLPFLAVLTDAKTYFQHPQMQLVVRILGIRDELELITYLSLGFAAAFTLANGLRLITFWVQARLAAAIGSDFSIELYRRTLHQDFQFYVRRHSGKLISTITNDFNATLSVVLNVLMIITQGLAIVAIAVALFAYDPSIAIAMSCIIGVAYMIVVRLNQREMVQTGHIRSDMYAAILRVLQDSFGGIRDILLGRTQKTFVDGYARFDRTFRWAAAKSQYLRLAPRYVLESIGVAILTAVAAYLAFSRGDIFGVLPTIGGIALAASRLLPAMQQVYSAFASMQAVHVSLYRTLVALDRPLDSVSTAPISTCPPLRRALTLEDVWFRYGSQSGTSTKQDWVLRGVSLDVPVNKTVALVGVTGSGKSTIADVLLGLLRPQQGRILLDGVPLDEQTLAGWRRMVASVPQSIFLSDSSVSENIAFGVPAEEIDDERVRQAARSAWVAEFIEDRPMGYGEIIGEHGIRLSGGQRQRIGIARALYRSASLIVFDEATSALDNTMERAVMNAIEALKGQTTIVLIAHRLSTIRNADLIFEIDSGRVVARGTYEELLERSVSFRRMVSAAKQPRGDTETDAVIV